MTAEQTKEELQQILVQATELMPDAHIQVMATYNTNGNSVSIYQGVGNWYARQGLAHEFINQDMAQVNAVQLAEQLHEQE